MCGSTGSLSRQTDNRQTPLQNGFISAETPTASLHQRMAGKWHVPLVCNVLLHQPSRACRKLEPSTHDDPSPPNRAFGSYHATSDCKLFFSPCAKPCCQGLACQKDHNPAPHFTSVLRNAGITTLPVITMVYFNGFPHKSRPAVLAKQPSITGMRSAPVPAYFTHVFRPRGRCPLHAQVVATKAPHDSELDVCVNAPGTLMAGNQK